MDENDKIFKELEAYLDSYLKGEKDELLKFAKGDKKYIAKDLFKRGAGWLSGKLGIDFYKIPVEQRKEYEDKLVHVIQTITLRNIDAKTTEIKDMIESLRTDIREVIEEGTSQAIRATIVGKAEKRIRCAICSLSVKEEETLICRACNRVFCQRHLNIEHKVCDDCAKYFTMEDQEISKMMISLARVMLKPTVPEEKIKRMSKEKLIAATRERLLACLSVEIPSKRARKKMSPQQLDIYASEMLRKGTFLKAISNIDGYVESTEQSLEIFEEIREKAPEARINTSTLLGPFYLELSRDIMKHKREDISKAYTYCKRSIELLRESIEGGINQNVIQLNYANKLLSEIEAILKDERFD